MKYRSFDHVTIALAAAAIVGATAMADSPTPQPARVAKAKTAMDGDATKVLRTWPPGPQLAGQEMMAKYGAPQEVTPERMIWRNAGPFKRIMLTREELPHHFPIPHKDYLEHTISYKVPVDKTDEVFAFDSSITIYRVAGELSARCDLESNNVLTLNLAKDVIDGKKSVKAARKEFGDSIMARTLGKNLPITVALQFKPQTEMAAADFEVVTIPGAPKPADPKGPTDHDGETLALLIALDNDEVHAAMAAKEKKLARPVLEYATMLHQHHGKHVQDTVLLGMKSRVRPEMSAAVDALQAKNAGGLAKIIPLDGDAFGRAYLELMVKGHEDAIKLIDQRLASTRNEAVKTHLGSTRKTIASHLQAAKELQAKETTRTSSR